jgi:hypothetical protein
MEGQRGHLNKIPLDWAFWKSSIFHLENIGKGKSRDRMKQYDIRSLGKF